MAYDKVVNSATLDAAFTNIANAIRAKTGKEGKLSLEQMATEIESFTGLENVEAYTGEVEVE